jgi:hypothetical protein
VVENVEVVEVVENVEELIVLGGFVWAGRR